MIYGLSCLSLSLPLSVSLSLSPSLSKPLSAEVESPGPSSFPSPSPYLTTTAVDDDPLRSWFRRGIYEQRTTGARLPVSREK